MPPKAKEKIIDFVNQELNGLENVEKIFIEQKSDNVFEVIVITKKINPSFEKKLVELEYEVERKYNIPSYFKTFSNASSAVALLTQ